MSSALGEQPLSGAGQDTSAAPSEPRCTEIFRITPPESWSRDSDDLCLGFSWKPKLSFQISQCSSWSQGSVFPLFNIWRPGYFGISLPQLGSDRVKLNRKNDLIVTGLEHDTEAFKISDTDTIPFNTEGVVAGIDVDPPSFFACSVCFGYRGQVHLPNGERWTWVEIDGECYQFTRNDDGQDKDVPMKTLMWQFGNSWLPQGLPADLPFRVNGGTRICRINESGESPIAVMNRDRFVFFDELGPKMAEIQTEDNRALILMSGLAIAQYEGLLAK